jgi:hypothetical protein
VLSQTRREVRKFLEVVEMIDKSVESMREFKVTRWIRYSRVTGVGNEEMYSTEGILRGMSRAGRVKGGQSRKRGG